MTPLAIGGLGTPELLIILAVLVLLFGATKLPELARGSGRALRIFKAETKGLMDDDDDDDGRRRRARPRRSCELEAKQRDLAQRQAELDAEARAPATAATPPDSSLVDHSASPGSSRAARSTRSAPTAGWRSPTTCASCAPGCCGRPARRPGRVRRRAVLLRPAARPGPDALRRARARRARRRGRQTESDRQRRHRAAAAPAEAVRRRCGWSPPARTGSTRSGRSSCPGCTQRAEVDAGSSPRSPGRCSSPASPRLLRPAQGASRC